MESVGEFFRQVRETKGLTLDEVASKTRIHPDFLRALEEANFAKLPDQVFAKGFVRSYARSLGLDEEDVMRRFEESAGAFYNKQTELERLRVQQIADEHRRKANRKVVIAAAAVALLGLVLLLTREQSTVVTNRPAAQTERAVGVPPMPPKTASPPAPRNPADVPPASASAERTESQPGGPGMELNPTAPGVMPSPPGGEAVTPAPLPPTTAEPLAGLSTDGDLARKSQLILELEALELSWVVVQADGASPHEALLRPGERVRWTASDRFIVTLGNAGGVRVELNGKPQGPFGPKGKVARDIVLKR
jgi:cytoskeletal protein RodZ